MAGDERPGPLPTVYLVVMDRGGIFGAFLDDKRAMEAAEAIEGVVAPVPAIADYRPAKGAAGE